MKTADLFPKMLLDGLGTLIGGIVNQQQVSVEMDLSDQVILSPWAEELVHENEVQPVPDSEQMYAMGAMMGKYRHQLAVAFKY